MQTKDKLRLAKIKQAKKKQAEAKKHQLAEKRAESKAKAYQKYVDELKDKINELKQGHEGLSEAITEAVKSIDAKEDIKSLETALNELREEINKGISVKNIKDAKSEVKIPEYKAPIVKTQKIEIPKNLAKDTSIQRISKILEDIEEKLEPNQKPEKFIPYRRVRWNGRELVFDDSLGRGASGSSSGGLLVYLNSDGVPVSVGANNPLPVTDSGGGSSTPTTAGSFQKDVATAGTRVQLPNNSCLSVTLKAKIANTGSIYVGVSDVDSTTGLILAAGESVSLDISNTNKIYIDSSVNGEGITALWVGA